MQEKIHYTHNIQHQCWGSTGSAMTDILTLSHNFFLGLNTFLLYFFPLVIANCYYREANANLAAYLLVHVLVQETERWWYNLL